MGTAHNAQQKSHHDHLTTKVCPCCGAVLFADMDVCYGCLYDFRRKIEKNPLENNLHKVTETEDLSKAGNVSNTGNTKVPPPEKAEVSQAEGMSFCDVSPDELMTKEIKPRVPRVVSEECSEDFGLRIEGRDTICVVPLVAEGLIVGRGESCDVILRSPEVSRKHIRIVPEENGAYIQDLGSTNPARVQGHEVREAVHVQVGEKIDLCGIPIQLVRCK
ncbi:MAG: FHA domain-containing protein [Atopobiaceae bacterium]